MRVIVGNIKTRVIFTPEDYKHKGLKELEKELKKLLRIRKTGYDRTTAFKQRRWDGYTSLVSRNNEFATGFLKAVLKKFDSFGLNFSIKDNRENVVEILPEFNNKVGNSENWEGLENQTESVKKIFANKVHGLPFIRGVVNAATNAGKTTMMALIINNCPGAVTLIICDRTVVYDGTLKFLQDIYTDAEVGQISGKKEDYQGKRVILAMLKSLHNRLANPNIQKLLKNINITLLDECHRASSDTALKIASFNNSYIKLLFSGTPFDISDSYKKLMQIGQSAEQIVKISNQDLIASGKSVPPKCKIFLCREGVGNLCGSYEEEYTKLVMFSVERAEIMCSDIEHKNKPTLIVVQRKEHGEFLLEYFRGRLSERRVEFAHGTDKGKKEKISGFTRGDFDYLISTSILQEGANIHRIQAIWYARGGKSKVSVKQFYGRGARNDGTVDYIEFNDFFDIGSYVSPHSRKRIKVLKGEGFEVEFNYEHNAHFTPKKLF